MDETDKQAHLVNFRLIAKDLLIREQDIKKSLHELKNDFFKPESHPYNRVLWFLISYTRVDFLMLHRLESTDFLLKELSVLDEKVIELIDVVEFDDLKL